VAKKTCSVCKISKPDSEYRWKNKTKGIRISMCRGCDKKYRANRYQEKRKEILEANRRSARRRRDRVAIRGVLEDGKRRCIDCLKAKPAKDFRWKNKAEGLRIPRCKECDRAWRSDYYENNKDQFIENNKRQYKKLRELVKSRKTGVPCADCGNTFPSYAMDFDHRDGSSKIDKVSTLVYRGSERLITEEISKCDVVCAVCHRIRTFGRSDNGRK